MPEKEVPGLDTVSSKPITGDRIHFANCVWTLIVTDGKVTLQDVPPSVLSFTLEGFRARMTEVLHSITWIKLADRSQPQPMPEQTV
jgi:hypothetical protein